MGRDCSPAVFRVIAGVLTQPGIDMNANAAGLLPLDSDEIHEIPVCRISVSSELHVPGSGTR